MDKLTDYCIDCGLKFVYGLGPTEKDAFQDCSRKKRLTPSGPSRSMTHFDLPCRECLVAPAEVTGSDGPICSVCDRKIKACGTAYLKWPDDIFHPHDQDNFIFDTEGDLEREQNRLAVVCMDGNRLGSKIPRVRKPDETLDDFENRKKEFSKIVEKNVLGPAISEAYKEYFEHKTNKKGKVFFRPLVLGGDDFIAIMDPAKSLDFCILACREFNELSRKHPGHFDKDGITISAGIAITHRGYPLARAIKLAEELLKNAKDSCPDGSEARIDFDLVLDSALQDMDGRKKLRQVKSDNLIFNLTYRPMAPESLERYISSSEELVGFKKMGRSQIKSLTNMMLQGRLRSTFLISRLLLHHDDDNGSLANILLTQDGQVWEEKVKDMEYISKIPDLQLIYEIRSNIRRAQHNDQYIV